MDPIRQITSFNLGSSGLISVLSAETAQQGSVAQLQQYLYIPTKLDTDLLPAVKRGDFDLVIISGNAGDGKSAFLLQLRDGEKAEDGRPICVNRDATHSDSPSETQAERMLRDFAPFSDDRLTQCPGKIQIIAMNTGMLISFFDEIKNKQRFPNIPSFNTIETLLKVQLGVLGDDQTAPQQLSWRVLLVDLNYRSVVDCKYLLDNDPSSLQGSLFSRLISRLVDKNSPMWERCYTSCPTTPERCYVFQNVAALRDPVVQQRLHLLLGLSHLRNDQHLSVRALLNLLSYLIAGHFRYYQRHDDYCQCVADWIQKDAIGELLGRMYYNTIFSDKPLFEDALVNEDGELRQKAFGEGGELIENLNELDFSAQVGEAVDAKSMQLFYDQERVLSEGTGGLESYAFTKLLQILCRWDMAIEEAAANSQTQRERQLRQHMRSLRLAVYKLLKRRSYFADSYQLADLVVPYPHLGEFLRLVEQIEGLNQGTLAKAERARAGLEIEKLLALVTRALLKSDRIKEGSMDVREGKAIQLRLDAGLTQMAFNVLATESISCDAVPRDVPPPESRPYMEYATAAISLHLKRQGGQRLGRLDVDLRLFEFLHKIDQGYLPSASDLERFAHLQTFKSRIRRQLGDEIESMIFADPQGIEIVRVKRTMADGAPFYELDVVNRA